MRDSPVRGMMGRSGTLGLLAFPCAGGTTAAFAIWSRLLPDDIKLWPARLPGRQDRLREPPFTSMAPLVRALATELASVAVTPFALLGHSMGALVAFELARELRRRGEEPPIALLVVSSAAPHLPRRARPLRELPDEVFVAELRRLNGMPDAVARNNELLELVMPALRADIALCEVYKYLAEPPLAMPIAAFVGTRDPRVRRTEMAAWKQHTTKEFDLSVLPGDHFFSGREECELVSTIADYLLALREPLRVGTRGRDS